MAALRGARRREARGAGLEGVGCVGAEEGCAAAAAAVALDCSCLGATGLGCEGLDDVDGDVCAKLFTCCCCCCCFGGDAIL